MVSITDKKNKNEQDCNRFGTEQKVGRDTAT